MLQLAYTYTEEKAMQRPRCHGVTMLSAIENLRNDPPWEGKTLCRMRPLKRAPKQCKPAPSPTQQLANIIASLPTSRRQGSRTLHRFLRFRRKQVRSS